jgi:TonB family protein
MYFDFEDHRPDISPVGSAISWREGVLISIILHLATVILMIVSPEWFPFSESNASAQAVARVDEQERPRFVFIEPRVDERAPAPPERAELSDQDRVARAPQRAPEPANRMPFSRGNSPERVEQLEQEAARGRGADPEPAEGEAAEERAAEERAAEGDEALPLPETPSSARRPESQEARNNSPLRPPAGGALGEALRNLGRYVERGQREQFENPQGAPGAFGPAIQFDSKGVEFGPWIRRFIAQVKGNWLIPYAAVTLRGHVVITFNVHKNGAITDLAVVKPSNVEAFNSAAYGALAASNPTLPLPPEYPVDRAFFTVTFFYNEQPY